MENLEKKEATQDCQDKNVNQVDKSDSMQAVEATNFTYYDALTKLDGLADLKTEVKIRDIALTLLLNIINEFAKVRSFSNIELATLNRAFNIESDRTAMLANLIINTLKPTEQPEDKKVNTEEE